MPKSNEPVILWSALADVINCEELADEAALAAAESPHGKVVYQLLRDLSDGQLPPLEAKLRLLETRRRG